MYASVNIIAYISFSPLPKTSVPREQLPMRDATFFTTRAKVPRPPQAMVPVPHGGLKSEQKDQYIHPSDVKVKEANFCPVDTPYTLPGMKQESIYYLSPVKRICVFEHSVVTNFNCACPAIQWGQGPGFLSEGSS